jgi:hypothetical protein
MVHCIIFSHRGLKATPLLLKERMMRSVEIVSRRWIAVAARGWTQSS